MKQNNRRDNRRGMAIHLLASLCLGVMILVMAVYLNGNQPQRDPPLLQQLKIQYQMESGIIVLLQELIADRTTASATAVDANVFQPRLRTIAPGVTLSLLSTPIDDAHVRFEAHVEGPRLQSRIQAVARKTNDPATPWRLQFFQP